MILYRVSYRQRPTDAWQTTPAASVQDAYRLQRTYRAKLWAAKVQWWNEVEGRWIG